MNEFSLVKMIYAVIWPSPLRSLWVTFKGWFDLPGSHCPDRPFTVDREDGLIGTSFLIEVAKNTTAVQHGLLKVHTIIVNK